MEKFTYYQVYYINPVTKRKYKTNFIFKNKKDADFFVNNILKKDSKEHFNFFVKEITISYYTSLADLLKSNNNNNNNEKNNN